jgi:hypothetical protein
MIAGLFLAREVDGRKVRTPMVLSSQEHRTTPCGLQKPQG